MKIEKETIFVLAFLLFYFALLLHEYPKYGLFWDEGGHLSNGFFVGEGMKTFLKTFSVQQTIGHLKAISEQYNVFIVLHYPPVFYLLEGISFGVLGPTELAGRLISILFSLGTIFATYLLGKELFNRRTGIVSAIFLAAAPLFFRSSLMAMMDTASAFFFVLSVYAFVRFLNGKTSHIVLGVVLGLALLTRFEPLLLFGIFLIYLAVTKNIRKYAKQLGIAFFIALVMAAPWYLISFGRANTNTGTELSWFLDIVFKRHHGGMPGIDLSYFAGVLLPSLSQIVGLVALLGAGHILIKKNTNKATLVLIVWAITVYLFFSITPVRLPRYSINYLPAFSLLAGNFVVAFSKKFNTDNRKMLAALVIVAIVFSAITYEKNIDYMDKQFVNSQSRLPIIEETAGYLAENSKGERVFQLSFRNEMGPAAIPFYLMTKYPESGIRYRDLMSFTLPEEGNMTRFIELLNKECPGFIVTIENKEINDSAITLQNITSRYYKFIKTSKSFQLDKTFEHTVFDIMVYKRVDKNNCQSA